MRPGSLFDPSTDPLLVDDSALQQLLGVVPKTPYREVCSRHCSGRIRILCPQWWTLIADDIVWELAYAPAIDHPARLAGKAEVIHHVTWFLSAVENFRFLDPKINAFADPQEAVAQVRAEGLIKPTGRIYRREYVVFLRADGGKIRFIREYFDPTRAAKALERRFSISNRGDNRQRPDKHPPCKA